MKQISFILLAAAAAVLLLFNRQAYTFYFDTAATLSVYSYHESLCRGLVAAEYKYVNEDNTNDTLLFYLTRGRLQYPNKFKTMQYSDQFFLKYKNSNHDSCKFECIYGPENEVIGLCEGFRNVRYVPSQITVITKDSTEVIPIKLSKKYNEAIKKAPYFSILEEWKIVWKEAYF